MSIKDKDKFRLLILQTRYLKAKLLMDQQVFEEAQVGFAKAYQEVCKTVPAHERRVLEGALLEETMARKKEEEEKQRKKQQKAEQPIEEDKPEEEQKEKVEELPPTKNERPEDPNVQKIYRAIARKSHPDKLANASAEEVKQKEELFTDAQTAIKEKDFLSLYDIAKRLDIELPEPSEGQIRLLTNNVKQIKKELKLIKETAAWNWHHEEDEDTKEAILIRYMQYIYQRFK